MALRWIFSSLSIEWLMRSEAHLFIFLIDVYALLKNISVNKLRSAFSCKETEQSRLEAIEHLHVMFFADFPTFVLVWGTQYQMY